MANTEVLTALPPDIYQLFHRIYFSYLVLDGGHEPAICDPKFFDSVVVPFMHSSMTDAINDWLQTNVPEETNQDQTTSEIIDFLVEAELKDPGNAELNETQFSSIWLQIQAQLEQAAAELEDHESIAYVEDKKSEISFFEETDEASGEDDDEQNRHELAEIDWLDEELLITQPNYIQIEPEAGQTLIANLWTMFNLLLPVSSLPETTHKRKERFTYVAIIIAKFLQDIYNDSHLKSVFFFHFQRASIYID